MLVVSLWGLPIDPFTLQLARYNGSRLSPTTFQTASKENKI
jgi:hypothetical protein